MTLIDTLKDVCLQIPGYRFEVDEEKRMDQAVLPGGYPSIFFHEFREGKYTKGFFAEKNTVVQLYVSKLCTDCATTGTLGREAVREEIENEAVLPLIDLLSERIDYTVQPQEWKFEVLSARFHPDEVGILLTFNFKQSSC